MTAKNQCSLAHDRKCVWQNTMELASLWSSFRHDSLFKDQYQLLFCSFYLNSAHFHWEQKEKEINSWIAMWKFGMVHRSRIKFRLLFMQKFVCVILMHNTYNQTRWQFMISPRKEHKDTMMLPEILTVLILKHVCRLYFYFISTHAM